MKKITITLALAFAALAGFAQTTKKDTVPCYILLPGQIKSEEFGGGLYIEPKWIVGYKIGNNFYYDNMIRVQYQVMIAVPIALSRPDTGKHPVKEQPKKQKD